MPNGQRMFNVQAPIVEADRTGIELAGRLFSGGAEHSSGARRLRRFTVRHCKDARKVTNPRPFAQ